MLKPQNAQGGSCMELFRDGSLTHCYSVNPLARQIQEFNSIIADSFREDSTSKSQFLNSRDKIVQAVHEYFGIPKEFILDVVKDIDHFGDAWD